MSRFGRRLPGPARVAIDALRRRSQVGRRVPALVGLAGPLDPGGELARGLEQLAHVPDEVLATAADDLVLGRHHDRLLRAHLLAVGALDAPEHVDHELLRDALDRAVGLARQDVDRARGADELAEAARHAARTPVLAHHEHGHAVERRTGIELLLRVAAGRLLLEHAQERERQRLDERADEPALARREAVLDDLRIRDGRGVAARSFGGRRGAHRSHSPMMKWSDAMIATMSAKSRPFAIGFSDCRFTNDGARIFTRYGRSRPAEIR